MLLTLTMLTEYLLHVQCWHRAGDTIKKIDIAPAPHGTDAPGDGGWDVDKNHGA